MIYKCKMCGGTLEIKNNESICTCEYCGTKQTLPKIDDEKKANLYDRANHFRMNNDFDKAASIYEQILSEDTNDAETYWSLVLCEYGIEYVEDPSTHKRIPTVNRAQFTSIFQDENYKQAIKLADSLQKEVYEEEAKQIDDIQKGILAISNKEEPYDIFICYKETDNQGRRTQDSVLANDLYNELTRDGYKVFFSRITLEDKLGTAYEPYIFAALNSAKAMIVIGTKSEYFNAVWVKNEWSRYLSLIKKDHTKVLIPAYKDMDPYDLPEEFSHLQAQDMSKLGFMQDLTRGVKKIIGEPSLSETKKSSNSSLEALIKRAYIFLEDKQYDKANDYSEKILDMNPENADAYLIKLLIQLKLTKPSDLSTYTNDLNDNDLFKKVNRYADNKLKKELSKYLDEANTLKENNIKDSKYNEALKLLDIKQLDKQNKALSIFESLGDWKDSKELFNKCKNNIEEIEKENEKKRLEKGRKAKEIKKAIPFVMLGIVACIVLFFLAINVIIPSVKYNNASKLLENKEYSSAYSTFTDLGDYKDSSDKAKESKYLLAKQQQENGDYASAYSNYSSIVDYEDTRDLLKSTSLSYIDNLLESGDYEKALNTFNEVASLLSNNFTNEYLDLKNEIYYKLALQKYDEKEYSSSLNYFNFAGISKDDQNYINLLWDYANFLANEKDYYTAIEYLEVIPNGSTVDGNISYETVLNKIYENKYNYVQYVKNLDGLYYIYPDGRTGHEINDNLLPYLNDLINANYPGASDLYDEIFGWKVEIVANNSEDDFDTDSTSLSKYGNWYFHIRLSGGEPNASTYIRYKGYFPDGNTSSDSWDEEWYDGTYATCWFYYDTPANGRTGTFKLYVYDGNGNVIGEKSVTITG